MKPVVVVILQDSSEGWWKNSGLELQYTRLAMDSASWYGRVEVLVRRMVEEFWARIKIHSFWNKLCK